MLETVKLEEISIEVEVSICRIAVKQSNSNCNLRKTSSEDVTNRWCKTSLDTDLLGIARRKTLVKRRCRQLTSNDSPAEALGLKHDTADLGHITWQWTDRRQHRKNGCVREVVDT